MTVLQASANAMEASLEAEQLLSQVSSRGATAAALWVAVAGVISYMFLPLIVGGLADQYGFSSSQLGLIGAAEAGGMGLANAVAAIWIRRWNWRMAIVLATVVMVGANVVCVGMTTFVPLLTARLVDGLAGGTLIAIGVACQSDNRNAGRVFGYFVALEMLLSSVGFLVLPNILYSFGMNGIFVALAVLSSTGLVAAMFHARRGVQRRADDRAVGRSDKSSFTRVVALLGALLFFMSQGGLWAFIERIGDASSISPVAVGRALALSSVFGIAGALGANVLSRRVGTLAAFSLVLLGELTCTAMLYGNIPEPRYLASVCLFILFWSMALPLMLTQFNELDGAGRLVVLLYAMGKLGYTLGPPVMGSLVNGVDFTRVLVASASLCAVGLVVPMTLSAWRGGKTRQSSAALASGESL